MLRHEGKIYYSITDVAQLIGRSNQTIKLWYAKKETFPELPLPPTYRFGGRRVTHFLITDIPMLYKFKEDVSAGKYKYIFAGNNNK